MQPKGYTSNDVQEQSKETDSEIEQRIAEKATESAILRTRFTNINRPIWILKLDRL